MHAKLAMAASLTDHMWPARKRLLTPILGGRRIALCCRSRILSLLQEKEKDQPNERVGHRIVEEA